ncbi:MAG: hypothetical protein RDU30_18595, partial [Desulfovibrionaceae bacterium]|nr:hypothetical protein [Desulfovibrionaceae bacterium]
MDFVTRKPVFVPIKQAFYGVVLVARTEGLRGCGRKELWCAPGRKKIFTCVKFSLFFPCTWIFFALEIAHVFAEGDPLKEGSCACRHRQPARIRNMEEGKMKRLTLALAAILVLGCFA